MSRITRALLLATLLALTAPAGAAAKPALVPVGDFSAPIYLTAPPRDRTRLFVVERGGTIQVVRDGTQLTAPFLDLSSEVDSSGERGLLSMAFAPDYDRSGLFYVYMVANAPAGEIQVREYRRSAGSSDLADPASVRIVFRATHDEAPNHNGGQIQWGPDGYLWLATGDGGGSNDQYNHARDLASPLGKLLRIDPRPSNGATYTVPAGNPFGTAVWAYGLRNPFRFSFDRAIGDLTIGDVGQNAREEIDWAPAASGLGRGGDYGWACREGTVPGPKGCTVGANSIPPVFDYAQGSPRAVTGGVVVRDAGLPTLQDRYLYADFFSGDIRSLVLARPRAADDRSSGLSQTSLAAFGEDACGHVYVVSLEGPVQRIQDAMPGPCSFRPAPPPLPPLPATPPAGGPPPRPDHTSPTVSVRAARKGRVGRRATPRILVTASEDCRVTIRARLAGTPLKRVRAALRGGRRTVVRLRPRTRAVRRIRRALRQHRRVTMTVSVVAVDPAGNVGRLTSRLKLRRG
jgi:glucose/arabinose dehydrogenase